MLRVGNTVEVNGHCSEIIRGHLLTFMFHLRAYREQRGSSHLLLFVFGDGVVLCKVERVMK